MNRRFHGIARIVSNAKMLSDPVVTECFYYECEDPDVLVSVMDEAEELAGCLPEGIELSDIPGTYCGNKKSKIYGLGTCDATQGHQLLVKDAPNRVMFKDPEEAESLGYRPCRRCMREAYREWKSKSEK